MSKIKQSITNAFSTIQNKFDQIKTKSSKSSTLTSGIGHRISKSSIAKGTKRTMLAFRQSLEGIGLDTSRLGTRVADKATGKRSFTLRAKIGKGSRRSSSIAKDQKIVPESRTETTGRKRANATPDQSKAESNSRKLAIKKSRAITLTALVENKGITLTDSEKDALKAHESLEYDNFNAICDQIDKKIGEDTSPQQKMTPAQMQSKAKLLSLYAEHRGVILSDRETSALRDPSVLGSKVFEKIAAGIEEKIAQNPRPLPPLPQKQTSKPQPPIPENTAAETTNAPLESDTDKVSSKPISDETKEQIRETRAEAKKLIDTGKLTLSAVEAMAIQNEDYSSGPQALISTSIDGQHDETRLKETLAKISSKIEQAKTKSEEQTAPKESDSADASPVRGTRGRADARENQSLAERGINKKIQKGVANLKHKGEKHAENPDKLSTRLDEGIHHIETQLARLEGGTRNRIADGVREELENIIENSNLPSDKKAEYIEQIQNLGKVKIEPGMTSQKVTKVASHEIKSSIKANKKTAKQIASKREKLHQLRNKRESVKSEMKSGPKLKLEKIQLNVERGIIRHLNDYRAQLEAYNKSGTVPDKIDSSDPKAVEA